MQGFMRAKTISIGALAMLALVPSGCGDNAPQPAPTVTVAIPSTTGATEASTTEAPPPAGAPSGPAETATEDPRVNTLERDAARTVRAYVNGLDARDGAAVCALLVPGALAEVELPEPRASCAASLEASIGYRDPRGLPVWEGAQPTVVRVLELGAGSAKVIATVVTQFADRDADSVEDDVVYLTRSAGVNEAPQQRRGSATPRWLVAKPSSTLYRAVGIADVPPSVLSPPG
jgi:hypothetical protein